MADMKKFLDQNGVELLWERIQALLEFKVSQTELKEVENRVEALEDLDEIEFYGGSASDVI